MNSPTVSVVICCYTSERLRDIHEAVDSVLAQTHRPHEVIVAVDHNEDLFHALNAGLPSHVKVVLNDSAQCGSSATDNTGIQAATGDIVAFIDDDGVAEESWIGELVRPYDDAAVVAVGGKLVPQWQAERPGWFSDELNWVVGSTYAGHPHEQTEVRNVIFCNASIRRAVFDAVGMLPTGTGRSGDWGTGFEAEFFLRVKSVLPEGKVLYRPTAVVYHKVTSQRAKMRYLVLRSYNEGFHKAKVGRLFREQRNNALSPEMSYARYLALRAIPLRLLRFYRGRPLLEAGGIALCLAATGAGYAAGRVRA